MIDIYWNHRVLRRIEQGTLHLFVVEVFYNEEDNSILGWTEQESVWCDEQYDNGVDGIRQTLHWMLDATEKPILDEATLLAEAEANPLPIDEYETLSYDELLESLGLEREDVEDLRRRDER